MNSVCMNIVCMNSVCMSASMGLCDYVYACEQGRAACSECFICVSLCHNHKFDHVFLSMILVTLIVRFIYMYTGIFHSVQAHNGHDAARSNQQFCTRIFESFAQR